MCVRAGTAADNTFQRTRAEHGFLVDRRESWDLVWKKVHGS